MADGVGQYKPHTGHIYITCIFRTLTISLALTQGDVVDVHGLHSKTSTAGATGAWLYLLDGMAVCRTRKFKTFHRFYFSAQSCTLSLFFSS